MAKYLRALLLVSIFFIPSSVVNAFQFPETEYINYACYRLNGMVQSPVDDGSKVDCETTNYAIEFGFGRKWAEAVGQSLFLAIKTGKKAGIVLILEEENDRRALGRVKEVIRQNKLDIKLWTMLPEVLIKERESKVSFNGKKTIPSLK